MLLILKILNERYKNLNISTITRTTIQNLISQSDKLRYEINDNKIRAFYGHSVPVKIVMKESEELPTVLYHGTTFKAYMTIKEEGLMSKGRQYVHLTDSIQTAKVVARRRTNEPIILEIDVKAAKESGVKFFKSGDMYLVEHIPKDFLTKR